MTSAQAWVQATRPKTLTAALIPIFVGTALASALTGQVRFELAVFAFLSSVFIQIGTNFINDALDFRKGADTHERLGPQRGIQSGLISQEKVWWAGIGCFLLSMLLAIPLIQAGGWPIIAIGLFSLIAGYIYTGGPFPLAYVGLGDFFVLVFFGWVAVCGVYYLHTHELGLAAWVAGAQIGLLATVLIAINNLRDHVTDQKVNKKTLAVRLGVKFSRVEILFLSGAPFLMLIFWMNQGLTWAGVLPFLMIPIAIRLIRNVFLVPPSVVYNGFLAQAAFLHLGFGILFGIGLFLK